jgi:hypothetical protein
MLKKKKTKYRYRITGTIQDQRSKQIHTPNPIGLHDFMILINYQL